MNSTPRPPAMHGSTPASQLVDRILTARREFDAIDAKARVWNTSRPDERHRIFDANRQWFRTDPVNESSVFLYFDLSANRRAVERAAQVQQVAVEVLGDGNFNPAPRNRLHSTIITDIVAPHERLADGEVQRVAEKYAHLYRDMPPCLVFVLGPYLAPGSIILECRIHEPAVFAMRESAKLLTAGDSDGPRIPAIEYATLGYLTGGGGAALDELRQALADVRADSPPIPVHVDRILVTLTVNKAIVKPTMEFALTGPPTVQPDAGSDLSDLADPVEHAMLDESVRFAGGSP